MKKVLEIKLLMIISFLLCACISCHSQQKQKDVFEKHAYYSKAGDTLPYRLMRPLHNDIPKKYPLVLFLHGAGNRGKDNNSQLLNGVMNFASEQNRNNYPCYILVPQCADDFRWVETDWRLSSHIQPEKVSIYLGMTKILLDSIIRNSNIDTNRIYITGLSMGGFGTWDAISRWTSVFAAAVPVCGGGDTAKASLIKDIPIWDFHGGDDKVVLTSRSRDMIAAIKKSGGKPLYTEYPNVGHNAWDYAYINPELYKWLFSQSKFNKKK